MRNILMLFALILLSGLVFAQQYGLRRIPLCGSGNGGSIYQPKVHKCFYCGLIGCDGDCRYRQQTCYSCNRFGCEGSCRYQQCNNCGRMNCDRRCMYVQNPIIYGGYGNYDDYGYVQPRRSLLGELLEDLVYGARVRRNGYYDDYYDSYEMQQQNYGNRFNSYGSLAYPLYTRRDVAESEYRKYVWGNDIVDPRRYPDWQPITYCPGHTHRKVFVSKFGAYVCPDWDLRMY